MKSSRRFRKGVFVSLFVILLIAVLGIACRELMRYRYERARANWKTEALRQLSEMSFTNEMIRTELEQLRTPVPNLDYGWAHDHVILMTNGEYLVYSWRHAFNSGFVKHLLLAHGTDGKWYFSTYHFCNRLTVLHIDKPAGSIAEFCQKYSVREFDGKSNECLKRTWP
jgi:hypothetical protein